LEDGIGEYATFKAFCTAERRMFATTSFTNTGSLSWKRSPSRRGQQPGQLVIVKLMPLDHLAAAPASSYRGRTPSRAPDKHSYEFAGSRLVTVELEDRRR
jgi:hypothetical protein